MQLADLAGRVLTSRPGARAFAHASRALGAAAFSDDRELAAAATKAIFAEIVEPWSDGFEPSLTESYVAFMAEVLLAPGSPVAAALAGLGLACPADLRRRFEGNRSAGRGREPNPGAVRAVAVLSRVTLGADVAVTSTVLRAALRAFPRARIDFIGPAKNAALLAVDERVQGRVTAYGRSALLADRLRAWFAVRESVQRGTGGLALGEWLVVDPDSRLTQLGLLPVADDRRYRFWESRGHPHPASEPLGRLAAAWCSDMWGTDAGATGPGIGSLPPDARRRHRLAASASSGVATASFGVGGRETKRLGGAFEDRLLTLLRSRRYSIVLDCGGGETELRLVRERAEAFRGSRAHLDEGDDGRSVRADLVTWRGSLGGFGAWIRESRVFVGYDSAAAHVAAALGVPTIVVFAGAPSARFRRRWTPSGSGPVEVIPASGPGDAPSVLDRIERALSDLERGRGAGSPGRCARHDRN